MRDKKKIYWFGVVVILIISFALDWFGSYGLTDIFSQEQDGLMVHALDVGQGDAIFIETPDHFQILIDGGPDKSVLAQLGKVMSFSDRSIDMVILTHPHSDHVAGLVEVLRRYKIEDVYLTGVLHGSPDYLAFLDLIKDKEISRHDLGAPFVMELDHGIELEFLYPFHSFAGLKVENLNNNSIINRLVYEQ
ncbi:MBL fold metallo-hydrolase, partial [Patescibacteria group bacterium]|nr:MBL fold metallo-hydrolase [Patescibacteria group bacterium]